MHNFLIGCYDDVIIYGAETADGDIDIKFIDNKNPATDMRDSEILNLKKCGYIKLGCFERRRYGNYIYCRIYANLYRIDIARKICEPIETDSRGVCFAGDYILVFKDEPREYFYKLVPSGDSPSESVEICDI